MCQRTPKDEKETHSSGKVRVWSGPGVCSGGQPIGQLVNQCVDGWVDGPASLPTSSQTLQKHAASDDFKTSAKSQKRRNQVTNTFVTWCGGGSTSADSNKLSLALSNYSAAFWKLLRAFADAYTYFQHFWVAGARGVISKALRRKVGIK